MATIKFFFRTKISKLAPVHLRFTDGRGTDIMTPTPFRLYPEYWNTKTQTFKQRILFNDVFTEKDKRDIEESFNQLRDFILREHLKLRGPVTKEWLKSQIDKFYYKETPKEENLNQYITRFVSEAESGQRLCNSGNTKRAYSYGTLRSLRSFKLSFEMFQEQKSRRYNFNDITIDFYNEFLKFFFDRGCGANYVGKHIKTLKTIMRQAREEGFHNNVEIDRKSFKAINEEVDNIYLTEEELQKLYNKDLSENKLFEVVRDVFLVGCFTAQRYSDYSKINASNIREVDGIKVIELIQQKTGEKCIIPMRPELESILKRYEYNLPKTFEQKVNFNIKLIGKECEITDSIKLETRKGGLKVKKTVKKCDLIKTHTARRSGCTNMYLAGIPVIDIMKISGHKTEKEFLKYIKVGKEETALNLASHPYFLGSPLKIAE